MSSTTFNPTVDTDELSSASTSAGKLASAMGADAAGAQEAYEAKIATRDALQALASQAVIEAEDARRFVRNSDKRASYANNANGFIKDILAQAPDNSDQG